MIDFPKISLIVPIFNVEKYLAPCLESIVRQSYKNIEVICINDGSTDNSFSIAKKFAEKDCRIKLFTYENGGLSVARNRGIEKATGDYLQFVDSDDLLPDGSLTEVINLLLAHDLDMCLGNAIPVFDGVMKTQELEKKYRYERPIELLNKIETGAKIFSELIKRHYHPSACLYVFKKSLIEDLRFYPNIYHEDNIFTTQLLSLAQTRKVIVGPINLYIRRVRPDSITTQKTCIKHVNGLLKAYEILHNDYKSNLIKNKNYKKALRTYLSRLIVRAAESYSEAYRHKKLKLLFFKLKLLTQCILHPSILLRLKPVYRILFS